MWRKQYTLVSITLFLLVMSIVAVKTYLGNKPDIKNSQRTDINQADDCTPYSFPTNSPSNANWKPSPPISVHLRPLTLAPLGSPMRFCLTVVSLIDSANTRAFFELPDGIDVINGQTEYSLALTVNVPEVFELEVQANQPGILKIEAGAQSSSGTGSYWGDYTAVMLDVSELKTEIVNEAFQQSQDNQLQLTEPVDYKYML